MQNRRADRSSAPSSGAERPVSVGVTVDLEWTSHAGGHVKCWEKFAAAATQFQNDIDLTVYMLGRDEHEVSLARNVRYRILPPAFGTHRLPFVRTGTGITDLGGYHKPLARQLARHDVLHATHAFALSRTAARVARDTGLPLVCSVHTDLAAFTPVYTRQTLEGLFGAWIGGKLLADRLGLAALSTWNVRRVETAILRESKHLLSSNPADTERLEGLVGAARVSHLRRGIDRSVFTPERRDRERLYRTFSIEEGAAVLCFAGRVDVTKGVTIAAEAVRHLRDAGRRVHFLVLGAGSERARIQALLGSDATLAGPVSQETVAWAMASSDMFVFPSRSETLGNVVLEAKAAGAPVVIPDSEGVSQNVHANGVDGMIVASDTPKDWAVAIAALLDEPGRLAAIREAALAGIEARAPDWSTVVAEDLLPVWRAAAQGARP